MIKLTAEEDMSIDFNTLVNGLNNGSIEIVKCDCKMPNHVVLHHSDDGVSFLNGVLKTHNDLEDQDNIPDCVYFDTEQEVVKCGKCGHIFDIEFDDYA